MKIKKVFFITLCFTILLFTQLYAQDQKFLKAYFSYARFLSPEGPYIETYITTIGNSLQYKPANDRKLQGEIEITLVLKKQDSIINFKKYRVLSPLYPDTVKKFENFIDIQRLATKNGKFDLYLEMKDVHSLNPPFTYTTPITIDFAKDSVQISDIELVEKFSKTQEKNIFSKNGYDIFPYQSTFYPDIKDDFIFYFEIYNTPAFFQEEPFLVSYYLSDYNTLQKLDKYFKFKRKAPGPVIVVMDKFNIEKLPSGNYYFNIDIINKNNEIVAHRHVLIQRLNPAYDITTNNLESVNTEGTFVEKITDEEQLTEYIKSVYPIASNLETIFINHTLKNVDFDVKKKFFYSFWYSRNPANPEEAWKKYIVELEKVEKEFGTQVKKGYETDRGRVYLKYGPPNTRVQRPNEPDTYPYEVWHYYQVGNRSNVKFVFYNTDLSSNDYQLLHSNLFGEISDYKWRMRLKSRNNPDTNVDQSQPIDSWGDRSNDFFNNPR